MATTFAAGAIPEGKKEEGASKKKERIPEDVEYRNRKRIDNHRNRIAKRALKRAKREFAEAVYKKNMDLIKRRSKEKRKIKNWRKTYE